MPGDAAGRVGQRVGRADGDGDRGGAGGAQVVYAASSTTAGGTGDFKATSLSPSSQWQVGLQTGDFSWSDPLRVPPAIGGAAPSLSLSYDSGGDRLGDGAGLLAARAGGGGVLGGGGTGATSMREHTSCGDEMSGVTSGANDTGDKTPTGYERCWHGPTTGTWCSLTASPQQIVDDPATGAWRLSDDDGATVNYLRGSSTTMRLRTDGTHWEIIEPDGTQYWFGAERAARVQVRRPADRLGVDDAGGRAGQRPPVQHLGRLRGVGVHEHAVAVEPGPGPVHPNGNATSYYYSPQTSDYAFDSTSAGLGGTWLKHHAWRVC